MFGAFGNQVYNAPTMKSFGGIYASEAYSQFHAPQKVVFEANPLIKPIDNVIGSGGKKLVTDGRWTDDGADLLLGIAARSSVDDGLRTFSNKLIGDFGGLSDDLSGLSDDALENAIRNKLAGSSAGTRLEDTLSALSKEGGASRKLAQDMVNGIKGVSTKTGNLADDLITDGTIRNQFRQCCGLRSLTPAVDDATALTGKGLKVSDTPLGEQITINVMSEVAEGGARAGASRISKLGDNMIGGSKVMWGVATPIFFIGLAFGGEGFAKFVGGLLNAFGTGLFDMGDEGDDIAQCPDVGKECDETTVLAEGCYCDSDSNTIKQQRMAINYEGWLFFGGMAIAGIVAIGAVNNLLFPRR